MNLFESSGGLSFNIGKPLLWLVLVIFLSIYAIVSIVLFYHWRKYGMKNKSILLAEGLFVVVSLGLFVIAISSLSLI
jgi:hypothetical protein